MPGPVTGPGAVAGPGAAAGPGAVAGARYRTAARRLRNTGISHAKLEG